VWLSRAADGSFEHKQAAAYRDDREKERDDECEPAMSDQEGAMHARLRLLPRKRYANSISGSSLVKILDKRETLFISEDCMPVLLL
jgi:hypothetical protein